MHKEINIENFKYHLSFAIILPCINHKSQFWRYYYFCAIDK